jgi:hypothetical protein
MKRVDSVVLFVRPCKGGEAREPFMRILKLLIAVVVMTGSFLGAATARAQSDYSLIPAQNNFPALADSYDSAGGFSFLAPDQAALRLTEAVPSGVTFAPTVTLPPPVTVPEPGTLFLAIAGLGLLLRRSH